MPSNGIMEEIRSHLAQDKSSAEVIALGFKPPTVYKARRQLRRLDTKIEQPQQLASLGEQASEYVSLDRIAELETKAGSASEWERKYQDVESRLDHTIAAMGRKVQDWREKFLADEKARNGAEALAARHGAEVVRLQEVNQELQQKLESLSKHLAQEVWELVQPLTAELEELRPLKIWAGHSCTLIDKPTPVDPVLYNQRLLYFT